MSRITGDERSGRLLLVFLCFVLLGLSFVPHIDFSSEPAGPGLSETPSEQLLSTGSYIDESGRTITVDDLVALPELRE